MSEFETADAAEVAETTNEAIATMAERDWPREAELVRFYPRPGEARQGRMVLPAFIMSLDKTTGLATILTFYDADDARMIVRLPERSELAPRGWERIKDGESEVADEFYSILKGHNTAIIDLRNQVMNLSARLDAMAEANAKTAASSAKNSAKKKRT